MLAATAALGAQVRPQPTAPAPAATDPLHQSGANVSIWLLTMGQGEQVWELFGHNALWIHDDISGRDTVFNWGVFDFTQPNFIPRFLKGQMWYAMGGDSLPRIPLVYRYLDRDVYAQELALSASEKDSVLAQIRWYAQPENVNYRYDYFRDNCSTRIRDILDNALNGQMRAQARDLTGTTYRWHALRLMQGDKPLVLGVNIGLGRPADRELTKWEEMFLPRKLHDFVGALQVRDSAGGTHALVRSQRTLVQSTRGAEYASPPRLWPWLLGIGVIVGGAFASLGARALRGGRGARRTAAVVFGAWSFTAGVLGMLVALLWSVTDHVAAHANENLLVFNPIWLVLAFPLAISTWRGRESVWARRLSTVCAVLVLVAFLVPFSLQRNFAIIALGLPPALALAWFARQPKVGPKANH